MAYDSFELSEDWKEGYEKGTFKMEELSIVNKNVELFKGWFEDMLPLFMLESQENLFCLHILLNRFFKLDIFQFTLLKFH
jgi:hypothetical protein